MKNKPKVSVVVVSKDRKEDLIECIDGYLNSSYKPLEVIVVDNASSPPLKTWFKKRYPNVKLILSVSNVGAAEGRNVGLREAHGDYIVFSDDDAYPDRNMVKHLVEAFKQQEDAGIIQPLVYDKQKKNLLQGAGHSISTLTGRITAWGVREKDTGQYEGLREVPMCGCVWMVKREVFEKIGEYDEEYFIPYEDSDFSIRASEAGYKNYCYSKAKTWHQGIKTSFIHPWLEWLGITSSERAYRVARNKLLFMRKHSPFPQNLLFFFGIFPLMLFTHSLIILATRRLDVLAKYWGGVFSGLPKIPLLIAISFISTYVAVYPSLRLALFGDDWIVFFDLIESSGPGKVLDYSKFSGYFGAYNFPHYYMGVIHNLFGFDSFYYYFISFIFRSIAALSVSLFILTFTGSFFAAAAAAILFGVTAAGVETTNWVFNAPSYLSIAFSLFSLMILIKTSKLSGYLKSILLFMFSIMLFPQRMHGIIPIYFIILALIYIFRVQNIGFKNFLLKILIFLSSVYFLYKMRTFGIPEDVNWLVGQAKESIVSNGGGAVTSLFAVIGNLFVPDDFWNIRLVNQVVRGLLGGSSIEPRMGLITVFFVLVTFFLTIFVQNRKKLFFFLSLGIAFLVSLIFKVFVVGRVGYFTNVNLVMASFVGIYVFSWSLAFLTTLNDRKKVLIYTLIFLWPWLIIFISWVRNGFVPMSTILRYMVVASVGVPLLFGFVMSRIEKPQHRFLFFSLISLPALFHFMSTHNYLNQLASTRNVVVYDKLWDEFYDHLDYYGYTPTDKAVLMYFEGDYGRLYNIFYFGFPPKVAIKYNIHDNERQKIPYAFDNFESFLAAANGDGIIAHYNEPFVPEERIYAFRLQEDNLLDIKEETMKKLYGAGYPSKINNE